MAVSHLVLQIELGARCLTLKLLVISDAMHQLTHDVGQNCMTSQTVELNRSRIKGFGSVGIPSGALPYV